MPAALFSQVLILSKGSISMEIVVGKNEEIVSNEKVSKIQEEIDSLNEKIWKLGEDKTF
jgi:hypothetical protein